MPQDPFIIATKTVSAEVYVLTVSCLEHLSDPCAVVCFYVCSYMPQDSFIIATKTVSAEVYVFDCLLS
jgi:hypothetical protein